MRWIYSLKHWSLAAAVIAMLPAAHADISGKVFRDFNANGTFDTSSGFNELGFAGVDVKAFEASGVQVGSTASSAADGTYTLTGLTSGAKYRIEFSWTAAWLSAGAAGGTSVQFAQDGATHINFALANADEYSSSADPYLAIPQFINGAYNATGRSTQPSLIVIPYTATSPDAGTQTPAPVAKALAVQLGATWGVAYQRSEKTLYTSAVIRRFAGLGPLGTGGIYKVDMSAPTSTATGSLNYIDVSTIGIPTGVDPRDGTSCNSVASQVDQPAHDINAAKQVGTVGLGGISMDNEHERLWLVNMADRKLYALQNVKPSTTPTASDVLGGYAIDLPAGSSCTNGDLRPWAVKYHQGNVYVGAVCDASKGTVDDLAGYVLRFDPDNSVAGFAVEHQFSFNSARNASGTAWNAWRFDELRQAPILSSIEFDLDGSLMLGVIDRFGLVVGPVNYNALDCADTNLSAFTAQGDVLRFCKSGSSYLEDGATGCSTAIPAAVKTYDEYYWGEHGPVSGTNANFNEAAAGGLAFLAGSNQLLTTGVDPKGTDQSGIYWLKNSTGGDDHRYFIYSTMTSGPQTPETMAKTAGLGDIEIISAAAPIEIGNRVWKDTDADGIQDADEAGLDGIDVTLSCGTDEATVTTANGGHYLFSSSTNAPFLKTDAACTVAIDLSVAALKGLALTQQDGDALTSNDPKTDIRDSDASKQGSFAELAFQVGASGDNNHSLDFGFKSSLTDLTLSKTLNKTSAKRGDTISYTLTLTNESTVDASNVAVTDLLPAALVYVSQSGDGSYDAVTGVWSLGQVAGSSTKQLTINATIQ
jgi:uncharacterized repeat protein (TIGR01451 family)